MSSVGKPFCFRGFEQKKKWFWLLKYVDFLLGFYDRRLKKKKLHAAHPTLSKSPEALASHIDLKTQYFLFYLVSIAASLENITVDLT